MRFSLDSFRTQAAVIGLASLSLVGLAFLLIRDAFVRAEERLLDDAQQQCARAAAELAEQYDERQAFREQPLVDLPLEAQDLSLRALASTVLRGYEGVEGGYWIAAEGRSIGAAAGGVDEDLIRQAVSAGSARIEIGRDLVAAAATPTGDGRSAWAVKRVPGANDPVVGRERRRLAALAACALLGLGGLIHISIRLRRGAAVVQDGLKRLESDLDHRLPDVPGDFGEIARAINQMAEARTALEGGLRRQERLAALGKVVSGVAHEIRNPLNSMRLTLELLGRRLQQGRAGEREVADAIAEVDRLDGILRRLLVFGRSESEERLPQSLTPLIERAVKMVEEPAYRHGVRVRAGEAPGGEVEVDGPQIEQVLINLLLNAIEASPRGGEVVVRVDRGEKTCIEVRDSGEGVSDAIREHVFDPYFTTKESGSGLGLAVSREIAMRHGGDLRFESGPGGTVFTLELPTEAKEASVVHEG